MKIRPIRSFTAVWSLILSLFCLSPVLSQNAQETPEKNVQKDVVYGTMEGKTLLLDVYQPEGFSGKRPGIVFVHGGGWMGGDKSSYNKTAKQMAQKGYVAFSINYRLLPLFHYPVQLDDTQRAVRWIRAHAADYHLDPERLGAYGDSAGGHLVTFLGTRETRDNSDKDLARYSSRVQCVVDLYGPSDFTLPKTAFSPTAVQIVEQFIGKTREQAPKAYQDGSPILFVSKQSAPFLILHGNKDTLVPLDQSQRLYDALKKVGVEATFVIMENDGHGFTRPENLKRTQELTEAFFDKYLKP